MSDLLANKASETMTLEIQTVEGGRTETVISQDIVISADLIDGSTLAPYSRSEGPTTVVFRSDITGLTGGTSTKLDGIPTTTVSVSNSPTLYLLKTGSGGGVRGWQLVAGTDAEDATSGVVRPDDYNVSTNAKVWKQVI